MRLLVPHGIGELGLTMRDTCAGDAGNARVVPTPVPTLRNRLVRQRKSLELVTQLVEAAGDPTSGSPEPPGDLPFREPLRDRMNNQAQGRLSLR
jgi:hypothetical protein